MRIVQIEKLENGAHRNQTINVTRKVPNGWAVIPEDLVCENFPFGDITVENVLVTERAEEGEEVVIEVIPTVTSWTPGEIPPVEPTPEVEAEPTADELIDILLGVSENE